MNSTAATVTFHSFLLPSNCKLVIVQGLKKQKRTKERKRIIQGIGIRQWDDMLSSHLSAVNSHFAHNRHHWGCVIMQVFIEGVFPRARGRELANRAQQVAPRQKALACFYSISRSLTQQIHTQDPRAHTRPPDHTHTHHTWLHTYHALWAAGSKRFCWTTVPPLCFTLLHLELWASCIFNWCNLHKRHACQCVLCQWGCLRAFSTFPSHTATAPLRTEDY